MKRNDGLYLEHRNRNRRTDSVPDDALFSDEGEILTDDADEVLTEA